MAIKKKIVGDNGVTTEYHRIALLSIDVNNQNTILVNSYISEDGRQIEKDYASGLIEGTNVSFPYVDGYYISFAYDGTMTVEKAYEYLKTLPKFEGAEDV